MNLLNSKLKRLIPPTPREKTCRMEKVKQDWKREQARIRIEQALRIDNGLIVRL